MKIYHNMTVGLSMCECETCGRDDVDLTLVRQNTYYCNRHLPLFTQHWTIDPTLKPFETKAPDALDSTNQHL